MRRTFRIAAVCVAAGLAAAPAWAQMEVSFRSLSVLGVPKAAREENRLVSAWAPDTSVRFYTHDGHHYELEGYGCHFQFAPLREPLTDTDARVVEMVSADVAAYRGAAGSALGPANAFTAVAAGELVRVGPGRTDADSYGIRCDDSVVTAMALDVARIGGGRRLRILILQTAEGAGAQRSNVLAVAEMENLIFWPRTDEAMAAASPMTADLLRALVK